MRNFAIALLTKTAGLPRYLEGIRAARADVSKDLRTLGRKYEYLAPEMEPGSWLDKRLSQADPFHKIRVLKGESQGYPITQSNIEKAERGRETAAELGRLRARGRENHYAKRQAGLREIYAKPPAAPVSTTTSVERLRALDPAERAVRLERYRWDAGTRQRKASDNAAHAALDKYPENERTLRWMQHVMGGTVSDNPISWRPVKR
jgi:hypothetical protein